MVNINALYLPCWTARLWEKKGVKDPAASCLAFGVQFFPFREYPGPHLGDLMKWEFWTELSIQMETRKWIIKQPGVPLPFGFTSNENNLDKKKWTQYVHSIKFVPPEVTLWDREIAWVCNSWINIRWRVWVCSRVYVCKAREGGLGEGDRVWLESYHLVLVSFVEQSMLALLKVVPHGNALCSCSSTLACSRFQDQLQSHLQVAEWKS